MSVRKMLTALLFCFGFSTQVVAGGSGGPGLVFPNVDGREISAALSHTGASTEYLTITIETILEICATLTSGLAHLGRLGAATSPSPSSAVSGTISSGGEIAAELAITDYEVSRSQQRQVEIYGPMVADGTLGLDEAVNYVMSSNYTAGAGRENVRNALSRY